MAGVTRAGHVDLEPALRQPVGGDAVCVLGHGQADRATERVPEVAGTDVADPLAVTQQRLATVQQGLRVVEQARAPSAPSGRRGVRAEPRGPTKPPGLSQAMVKASPATRGSSVFSMSTP